MDYTIIISSCEDYVLFHVPCFCVVVNKNSNIRYDIFFLLTE